LLPCYHTHRHERQFLKPLMNDFKHAGNVARWIEDYGLLQGRDGHPIKLDQRQRDLLRLTDRKVILNCHRQFGKSTLASLLCFHRALFYPRSLCLLFSPSLRQSSENFRKISDALNLLEPRPVLEEDTRLTLKFSNQSRIVSLPGSERTIRGFSAPDLIIIDEAAQAEDLLFEAVIPMLSSNPSGRILLCSTPWGSRGFFWSTWTQGGSSWKRIKVTVSESKWISKEFLEEERASHPDSWYRSEFMCEFTSLGSSRLFTDEEIDALFTSSVKPLLPPRLTRPGMGTITQEDDADSLIAKGVKSLRQQEAELIEQQKKEKAEEDCVCQT